MRKLLLESQPVSVKNKQDYILTQNPELRQLLDADLRTTNVMTFPKLADNVLNKTVVLQTLTQDNLSVALDTLEETDKMYDDVEEEASETLRKNDPYKSIALKYRDIITNLINSFAARNIENQFLSNISDRSLKLIKDVEYLELESARFETFKEIVNKSMDKMEETTESSKKDILDLLKTTLDTIINKPQTQAETSSGITLTNEQFQSLLQKPQPQILPIDQSQKKSETRSEPRTDRNLVEPKTEEETETKEEKELEEDEELEEPKKSTPQPPPKGQENEVVFFAEGKKKYPKSRHDIYFPPGMSMQDQVVYLLENFPGIKKSYIMTITDCSEGSYYEGRKKWRLEKKTEEREEQEELEDLEAEFREEE